jgi:hypothetical protein
MCYRIFFTGLELIVKIFYYAQREIVTLTPVIYQYFVIRRVTPLVSTRAPLVATSLFT